MTCEHGGNRIPAPTGRCFAEQRPLLDSHRGYDPGALAMARALATALDAALVTSTVSRLLVDLNRSLGHRHLFSPATRAAPAPLRAQIVDRHYLPHRAEVDATRPRDGPRGWRVIHVASHSFTPVLDGVVRRPTSGLLYDPRRRPRSRRCARAGRPASPRVEPALRVRRNYPYAGKDDGLTAHLRASFGRPSMSGSNSRSTSGSLPPAARASLRLRRVLIETLRSAVAS